MFETQQRFGVTIAGLLAEVCAGTLPAVMPDEGTRRKRDPVTCLLQSPAEINVVPRFTELWIEAIDGVKRLPPKRHIAARHVLGDLIALQHMHRLGRARRNVSRHRAV